MALIVFLRLRSIKHPMTFQDTHKKLSSIVSATIWIGLSVLGLIYLAMSFPPFYNKTVYVIGWIFAIYILMVFPILLTIIMYGVLLYTLKKGTSSTHLSRKKKTMAKLSQRVVVCLVVCNVPYIVWVHYLGAKYPDGRYTENVLNTNYGVRNLISILIDECFY